MRLRLPWRWLRRRPVPRRLAGADDPHAPGDAWTSLPDFLEAREGRERERFDAQWRVASAVLGAHAATGVSGLCTLCGGDTRFGPPGRGAGGDLREGLACRRCGINARMRHALALLVEGLDPSTARVYVTEQASRGFVWLQHHVPSARGSEYGLDAARRARFEAWYRDVGGRGALCEADVTALPQPDASLDAVGCFDVLEHVPDYRAALREFARVLAPGGRLVLTAPFLEARHDTLVRARMGADGRIEHVEPEEIHGDPVSGGVLCYYHFGWDLLDAVREAGFRHAAWVRTFAPEQALFGLWALRAER
jgi:SAM-dependent methyltransferase